MLEKSKSVDPGAQKRNRRSRRLQKKNSLDVNFRRRFSMLRDGNAAANNIYNESISGFNGIDLDMSVNGIGGMMGRESRASGMFGARASSTNLSNKIIDKRFNKMIFNMHGIPVSGNISNNKKQKDNNQSESEQPKKKDKKKKNQNVVEEHV